MLVPVLLQPPGTYHPTVHSQSTIFLLSKSRSLHGHLCPLQMQLLFTCIHNADVQPKWHTRLLLTKDFATALKMMELQP
jgi:hypothetical protein